MISSLTVTSFEDSLIKAGLLEQHPIISKKYLNLRMSA